MKKQLIYLMAFGLFSLQLVCAKWGLADEIVTTHLTTEYRENPIGIGENQPRFGWELKARAKGLRQVAWQIQVASDEEQLKSGHADMWDSGKQTRDQQNFISYEGKPLASAKRYVWRLRVWSSSGMASSWSATASFVTAILDPTAWKTGKWIAYEKLADSLRLVPGTSGGEDTLGKKAMKKAVIPLFRKDFTSKGSVREAFLFVTGLGQYEARLNGQKVGKDFLTPGWTNYQKRVLYNTYDVTTLLKNGENVLGAIVGTGFSYISRNRYRKLVRAEDYPMLRLKLIIRYQDGTQAEVNSDSSWKTAPSPITFSSIYGGEDYDAKLEQAGWDEPNFDAKEWKPVVLVDRDQDVLSAQEDYPLRIMETFEVKEKKAVAPKQFLYDFGQNASGIIRLTVRGKRGIRIRITPAEVLDDAGFPYQETSGGPYYFEYILKGGASESWEPRFSYYGFRYALVTLDSGSRWEDIQSIHLQSLHTRNSSPSVGSFSCSNPLFNQIYTLINWGIKSNLASVSTDCPHREKLGWLEQTHLIGASLKYNFNIYHLYNKIIDDMMEAQLPNGLVPDIAPEYVPFGGGFRDSPEWGSASIIIPWYLYQWYGDSSVLRKAYPMMKRYMDYLTSKADHHILSFGLGDWYDLGAKDPGVSQLTPIALTATATYFYDASLLTAIAQALGADRDADQYKQLAEAIKIAFNAKFYDAAQGVYATGSQTAYAMPLYMGLVKEENRGKVAQNLISSIQANHKALTAGDVGYRYLLRALEESGASQLIYEMNNRNDVPGYGYQLKQGATALTESWQALKSSSNNHMMLGHLMEWLYSGLGGIRQQDDDFGFRKIRIAPEMVEGIDWVKTSYHAISGEITVHWEKKNGQAVLQVAIPHNTEAQVLLPTETTQVKTDGKPLTLGSGIQQIRQQREKAAITIASGAYEFAFPVHK